MTDAPPNFSEPTWGSSHSRTGSLSTAKFHYSSNDLPKGLIFCSGWSWPSDKPYFHLQTRRMGCSAKCFFTGGAAAPRSQTESGKAAPGDTEHRPSRRSLRNVLGREAPRRNASADKTCSQVSQSHWQRPFFQEAPEIYSPCFSKLPLESRSPRRHCTLLALLLCKEASPQGTPPLSRQRFAALPVLLAFPRHALHPDRFFHAFEVG